MNAYRNIRYDIFGYFVEYMQNGKYMGSINIEKPDRDVVGYCGRQYHTATEDIIFKNKRIRKGEQYYTHLYPLCGRSNFDVKTCTFNNG